MFIKYPKTYHIEGSKMEGDTKSLSKLSLSCADNFLVIEEKMDGTQVGFCFNSHGEIQIQSRGTIIQGGNPEFDLLKSWLASHYNELWPYIGQRYIIFGEWLYQKHSIFYDQLPHHFLEYDIYDKETACFLDTQKRHAFLSCLPFIRSVKVIKSGYFKNAYDLYALIKHSHFISNSALESLKQQACTKGLSPKEVFNQTETSGLMEGLYIKVEEGGEVKARLKFIRAEFLHHIARCQHWKDQTKITNLIKEG